MRQLVRELHHQANAVSDLRSWYWHLRQRTDHLTAMRVLKAAVAVYAPDSVARLRRAVRAARQTTPCPYSDMSALRDGTQLLRSITQDSPWWTESFSSAYADWQERAMQQADVMLASVDERRWERDRVLLAGTRQDGCVLALLPIDLWPRTLHVRAAQPQQLEA